MEVVLLVVAVIGIALVVVPRLQRRRSTSVRRPASVSRRASVRRRRSAAVAAPVASWTPSGPAPVEDDGWDDDLGWEGVDSPAPDTREEWERWRDREPGYEASPAAEVPSVERWRAADTDDDETWDDDLGWEGEDQRVASSNGHGPLNGNGVNGTPIP